MNTLPLPENPTLDQMKELASRLHEAVRAGDESARALVTRFHPGMDDALPSFSSGDAELVVARSRRFETWSKLEAHLEAIHRFVWDPRIADPNAGSGVPADTLPRLACLSYGDWHSSRAEKARRMLAEHPEISRATIYTAATVGDVSAARALLAGAPDLANQKGGPLAWEPLLYACYSRLDSVSAGHSTLEVARLLLSHGADPNAGFLWRGNLPPFTALTGAFGEGEDGTNQPPHQHADSLARLLLDAGADPNDGQTLYNRHFNVRDDHLHLLFPYGLGKEKGGPWFKRFGDRLDSPSRMLVEELWAAAKMNFPARVRLLVEHGADVDAPGARDGRTPYEAAFLAGNRDIAAYLLQHGATRIEFAAEDSFAAACAAGDEEEARAMLARDPGLFERLGRHRRIELLHAAVGARRPDAIRVMAALGFDLSGMTRNTPMHGAAWSGDLEMVKLLVQLGADPNVREATYDATPLGWAEHNNQRAVAEFLAAITRKPAGH